MRIDRLLRTLSTEYWALEPRTFAAGVNVLNRKLGGESFLGAALHAELGIPMDDERTPPPAIDARLARIPIVGVIEQRASSLGASVEMIEMAFDRAMADKRIDGILLDIDSPGGAVPGVPEFAEKVYNARGQKPILAVANGMAASAAYWIGSAAKELWVTPSGEAGSIGVWMMHVDMSKHLEQEGFKVTAISAGKYKIEGNPWEPLTPEGLDFDQARVDAIYEWFVRDVARFRGETQTNVRNGYGEGRVLPAVSAERAKLVDKVGTFQEAVGRLASIVGRKTKRRAQAQARVREVETEQVRV